MIDTNQLFEIVDMRSVLRPMGDLGLLRSVPGGVQIYTYGGYGEFLELDDDNFEYTNDGITVSTPQGEVYFITFRPDTQDDMVMLYGTNISELVSACL